MKESVATT